MTMPEKTTDNEPVSDYVQARRLGVPFRNGDGALEYPTMRSRPQPDFTLDQFHRLLLIGSLTIAVLYTVWMVARIPSMPDQVPMHFAADGSVNRYGSPWEILGMAAVMLAAIIGCAVLTRFPRTYNYGLGKVTEDNIQAHYKNGVQMMIWTVATVTLIYLIALGGIAGDWPISPWVWVGLAAMLASQGFFIYRMSKL
ncbi:DUF1648 domain-containing protein [Nesterenkonia alkaliphila]|uniref:DUF1648 domain-containing protein n=2 Tax=Nesterenkonia alkaliphila TaxID=1463631 RepID=A0A7K1UGP6_9MICC|nr:DUF1648 domain-containing protein [Nesterenkonia alkaliphila]